MKLRFFERLSMFALLICMSLLCAVGARAQETGDIVGTVTDATGAVVPNATVTLTNTGTNVSQTAQTGGDGNYLFTLLQVGNYVVKVAGDGIQDRDASGVSPCHRETGRARTSNWKSASRRRRWRCRRP